MSVQEFYFPTYIVYQLSIITLFPGCLSRSGDSPIDLTADESVTDMIVMQQVADYSCNTDPPSSPIAPAYSPLTPPTRYSQVVYILRS